MGNRGRGSRDSAFARILVLSVIAISVFGLTGCDGTGFDFQAFDPGIEDQDDTQWARDLSLWDLSTFGFSVDPPVGQVPVRLVNRSKGLGDLRFGLLLEADGSDGLRGRDYDILTNIPISDFDRRLSGLLIEGLWEPRELETYEDGGLTRVAMLLRPRRPNVELQFFVGIGRERVQEILDRNGLEPIDVDSYRSQALPWKARYLVLAERALRAERPLSRVAWIAENRGGDDLVDAYRGSHDEWRRIEREWSLPGTLSGWMVLSREARADAERPRELAFGDRPPSGQGRIALADFFDRERGVFLIEPRRREVESAVLRAAMRADPLPWRHGKVGFRLEAYSEKGEPAVVWASREFKTAFEPASSLKLLAHLGTWRGVDSGDFSETDEIPMWSKLSGSCPEESTSAQISVREASRRMMVDSDNLATHALRAFVGPGTLDRLGDLIGLTSTAYVHTIGCGWGGDGGGHNLFSLSDGLRVLEGVDRGDFLREAARESYFATMVRWLPAEIARVVDEEAVRLQVTSAQRTRFDAAVQYFVKGGSYSGGEGDSAEMHRSEIGLLRLPGTDSALTTFGFGVFVSHGNGMDSTNRVMAKVQAELLRRPIRQSLQRLQVMLATP